MGGYSTDPLMSNLSIGKSVVKTGPVLLIPRVLDSTRLTNGEINGLLNVCTYFANSCILCSLAVTDIYGYRNKKYYIHKLLSCNKMWQTLILIFEFCFVKFLFNIILLPIYNHPKLSHVFTRNVSLLFSSQFQSHSYYYPNNI